MALWLRLCAACYWAVLERDPPEESAARVVGGAAAAQIVGPPGATMARINWSASWRSSAADQFLHHRPGRGLQLLRPVAGYEADGAVDG